MFLRILALGGVALTLAACMTSNPSDNAGQVSDVAPDEQRLAMQSACEAPESDPETAIAACSALINAGGDDQLLAYAYSNRGARHAILGNHRPAISDFSRSLALVPDAVTYRNRGTSYAQRRQYEAAIQDFDQAVSLDPNYGFAYADRGYSFFFLGDYGRAIDDLNTAISLDPNDFRAYYNRGRAYCRVGYQDQALADWLHSYELRDAENLRREQEWLTLRGFYVGPLDGTLNAELRRAATRRADLEC
ncbi:MAG: tetratricopeptide repeat protein [Pseudomonadota bacterium]